MPTKIQIVADDDGTLIALDFDVATQERHAIKAVMTEFPRERGADQTDHHRATPDELEAELVVSDSPIDNSGAETPLDRTADMWSRLRAIRDGHLLCLITSDLFAYENMLLVEASATRTAKDGTWLRAHVSFKEQVIFDTQVVVDPTPTRPRLQPQVDLGPQATTEAPPRLTSDAVQLLGALSDALSGGT